MYTYIQRKSLCSAVHNAVSSVWLNFTTPQEEKNDIYPDITGVYDSIKEMTAILQTLSYVSLRKHYFV